MGPGFESQPDHRKQFKPAPRAGFLLYAGSYSSFRIIYGPCRHGINDRFQFFSGRTKGIGYKGRHNRLGFTDDQLVRFQLFQVLDQHFFRDSGNGLPDLAVAFGAGSQLVKDDGLPIPAYFLHDIGHRTLELCFSFVFLLRGRCFDRGHSYILWGKYLYKSKYTFSFVQEKNETYEDYDHGFIGKH